MSTDRITRNLIANREASADRAQADTDRHRAAAAALKEPTIPPDVAAQVLYACDDYDPAGIPPDQWHQSLIDLIEHADAANRERLVRAYPEYVTAVVTAMEDTDGIESLRAVARSA